MPAPSNPPAQSDRSTLTLSSTFAGWRLAIPISLICFPLLWLRIQLLLTPLPLFDFMSYWVAGRFYLAGANPYAPAAMWPIEKALGWTGPPLVMLNPPWSLIFVAPLGLVSFQVAHYVCLVISLALEITSFLLLWRYFGGEKSKQWIALAIFATLLPAGVAEHAGQVTPLMLAGLTAFLYSLRHQRYLLAGVCLLPLGLKPHLLWLALLAIVLWTAQNRKWQLILGAFATYATATLAAIAYNHKSLGYLHGSTANAAMVTVCGVGGALRSIFGFQHGWLQFLPMAVGLPWFVRYWMRKRIAWSWEEDLPIVLLVSIGTAPYFWAHDFILAVPALISLAVAFSRTRTNWIGVSALYLLAQIAISVASVVTGSKAWMATASLIWILLYKMGSASLKREREAPADPNPLDLPLQAPSTQMLA
jgi:hypothetical protein